MHKYHAETAPGSRIPLCGAKATVRIYFASECRAPVVSCRRCQKAQEKTGVRS